MGAHQPFADTVMVDSSAGLRVVVVNGRHGGTALDVALPLLMPLSIGKHMGCDLVLSDGALSDVHAMVFERDGVLWLSRVPGSGVVSVDDRLLDETPAQLARGMAFALGDVGFRVEGDSLPMADLRNEPAKTTQRRRPRRRASTVARMALSVGCVMCGAVLLAVSMRSMSWSEARASASASAPTPGALPAAFATAPAPDATRRAAVASLDAAVQQITSYIGDPGVIAVARYPGKIELSGVAKSAATRQQLEKIGKSLPPGIELKSSVSYPKDETVSAGIAPIEPLSKLTNKVLQVAASERVPFIEIEDGERVFEGGQLNGYELLKIAPHEIVVRRDGHIKLFKVE